MKFIDRIYKASDDKMVLLNGGFGNRLNGILNRLDDLDTITFIWENSDKQCLAKWEDLFEYPKLNIEYGELYRSYWRSYYYFSGKDEQLTTASKFIKSLLPSHAVKKEVIKLPKGTDGYYARLLHPHSTIRKPFKVPDNCFLATDHKLQRELNTEAIQTRATGSLTDRGECRSKENIILAAADWLTLMQCSKIYEIGTTFDTFDSKRNQSTFLYAHKLIGMDVINLTREYELKQSNSTE